MQRCNNPPISVSFHGNANARISRMPGNWQAVPARQISKGTPPYSFLQSWKAQRCTIARIRGAITYALIRIPVRLAKRHIVTESDGNVTKSDGNVTHCDTPMAIARPMAEKWQGRCHHPPCLKNLFMKYCCPLPVTSTVLVIRMLPPGLANVRSRISKRFSSMPRWVGML